MGLDAFFIYHYARFYLLLFSGDLLERMGFWMDCVVGFIRFDLSFVCPKVQLESVCACNFVGIFILFRSCQNGIESLPDALPFIICSAFVIFTKFRRIHSIFFLSLQAEWAVLRVAVFRTFPLHSAASISAPSFPTLQCSKCRRGRGSVLFVCSFGR